MFDSWSGAQATLPRSASPSEVICWTITGLSVPIMKNTNSFVCSWRTWYCSPTRCQRKKALAVEQARAAVGTIPAVLRSLHLTVRRDRDVSMLEAIRLQCNCARCGHYGVPPCFTSRSIFICEGSWDEKNTCNLFEGKEFPMISCARMMWRYCNDAFQDVVMMLNK